MATVTVYHEVSPDDAALALRSGLSRNSIGDKTDRLIHRTDKFLDKHRPARLLQANVSRCNSIYAYLIEDGCVIDITDGRRVPETEFVKQSKHSVLALGVDDTRCYVSDLDTYDAIKQAISEGQEIVSLAAQYWDKLSPLNGYKKGCYERPEVMITYDISPEVISEKS